MSRWWYSEGMCYKSPGPRCSSHARLKLQRAKESGNAEQIKIAEREYAATHEGIQRLRKLGRDDLADKGQRTRDAQMKALADAMEVDELRDQVRSRMGSDELKSLISHRNETKERVLTLEEELESRKAEMSVEEIREAKFEIREAFFQSVEARQNLESYKDDTAHLVGQLTNRDDMFEKEYEGDTLGNMERMETYESNSREWLKQRQKGTGGSDLSGILKLDPEYGYSNYMKILESKTVDFDAMDDDEFKVTSQNEHGAIHGALERGDAWEPMIANVFASHHPETTLIHSKSTWRSKNDPEQVVNVDGLLASDGKNPDGILEIKTSGNPEAWEDGVPDGYRAQVLWYLDASGFDYAYVAVQIDDHEYREYKIMRGEKINDKVGTIDDARPKIEDFRSQVRAVREGAPMTTKRNPHPEITTATGKGATAARVIGSFNQEDPKEVAKRLRARVKQEKVTPEEAAYAELRETLANDTRDRVYVDLETTGFSDTKNEIIEIGWSRRDKDNQVKDEGSMLFTPDSRFLSARGTGASDVHHIYPQDVVDKPSFRDPEVQKKMNEVFDDTLIVAHNASFEKRFMNQNIDGFAERNHSFIDTMDVCKVFERDTPNNKLSSFVEAQGHEYKDAHRALTDTNMTADALFAFQKKHLGE